ncbi:MAG: hypothetical protein ACRERU_14925 [Methylococcales bacterium]
MANTNNDLEYLRRRLSRLERLVLALFSSEAWYSDEELTDELFHMLRRFYERGRDRDPEFLFLFERLLHRAPSEIRHRFDQRLVSLAKKTDEAGSTIYKLQIRFEEQVAAFRTSIDDAVGQVSSNLASSREEHSELRQDVHQFLVLQSLGLDLSEIPLPRFVPIRVYLSEADQKHTRSVSNAVRHLLDTFGFAISDDFPEESGSWWKKWFAKTKDATTQPEVIERLSRRLSEPSNYRDCISHNPK